MTDAEFVALLAQVRHGDEPACGQFVARFGPELARVVRVRLVEPLLQAAVDTADICQSVLLDFFVRVRLGQYELAAPNDLVRLLTTMARHKLLNHVRRVRTGRVVRADDQLALMPANDETPSATVMVADLIEKAAHLLTAEERQLAELRRAGQEWAAIAQVTGDSPESARKRLARALDRVCLQLGLRPEGAG